MGTNNIEDLGQEPTWKLASIPVDTYAEACTWVVGPDRLFSVTVPEDLDIAQFVQAFERLGCIVVAPLAA